MLDVSVVICTHNPRSDHLSRVLNGLRNQTLPPDRWELLIVDNASQSPVSAHFDLSWHPAARHLVENRLGVTWARQRGIRESSADLLVFVDDDNVLDKCYLERALKIKQEWPFLGAWGSGCIRGEFETEPPEHLRSWLPIREATAPRWSNLAGLHPGIFGGSPDDAIPWGAGMCVRNDVATAYSDFCDQSSLQIISRQGAILLNGEDTELCFVCCSRGLGVGIFPELEITHLIPQRRVSEAYIVRFAEGICLSNLLLRYKWYQDVPPSPHSLRVVLSVLKSFLLFRGVDRQIRLAWVRALIRARRIIEANSPTKAPRQPRTAKAPGAIVSRREPAKAVSGTATQEG